MCLLIAREIKPYITIDAYMLIPPITFLLIVSGSVQSIRTQKAFSILAYCSATVAACIIFYRVWLNAKEANLVLMTKLPKLKVEDAFSLA